MWVPCKANVCHRVHFLRRRAPIMFPIWMRVFGFIGVLSVEEHPSGDYHSLPRIELASAGVLQSTARRPVALAFALIPRHRGVTSTIT
jgi:hypothetical protein